MSKKKNKINNEEQAVPSIEAEKEAESFAEAEISKEMSESDEEKAKKKAIRRRKLKYGSVATAITVICIAMVVLVNVILNLASNSVNMNIDLTDDSIFEISQETKDYLNTIDEHVDIVCMSDELTFQTSTYIYLKQAYEVLKKYEIYSDNVEVTYVDVVENPTYIDRYSQSYSGEIDEYNIVIESDKRIKVVSIEDLYDVEMNSYYQQEIVASNAEQVLTSAIMYVTDPSPIQAVVFSSESAGMSYDNVIEMLESNGYEVTEIDPLKEDIPEDTDLVVINAPLNDYNESIIDKLYSFLDNSGALGKNLIYIADNAQNDTTNINTFLEEWGISVGSGVVGDSDTANILGSNVYQIGCYIEDNDYSTNVSNTSLPVYVYYSRPISILFDTQDYRSTVNLLSTDETGFIMTDEIAEAQDESLLTYGEQSVMALGRKYMFDSDNNMVYSNVLVVGSAENLHSIFTGSTYYNNGEYFLSVLNTMTGKNTGISIVSKDLTSDSFDVTLQDYNICTAVFIVAIPLAVLIVGIVVYVKRRTK